MNIADPDAVGPSGGVPGAPFFDHRPIADALENHLQDWLNRPVQDILDQHNLGQLPDVDANDLFSPQSGAGLPGQPAGAPGLGGGNNFTGGLMKPATDLLGSVGNGIFQGVSPQQWLSPITSAFSQAAGQISSTLGSLFGQSGGGWAGQSANAAATSTAKTLAHGAATAAQSTGLVGNYTAAAADSTQGYSDLLETIHQGQIELSGLAGGLPWTAPEMVDSASRTTARATAIVTQLESTLTGEAGATQATGAPVEAANQLPQLLSAMMSVGTSMISPAMSATMMPLMLGVQAMQTGLQAGTGLISSVGQGASGPAAVPASLGTHLASAPKGLAGGGGGVGGGAGRPAATMPARALSASPMIQRETNAAPVTTSVARTAGGGPGGATGGAGMMGGAGAAGHGNKAGASNNHTTASFLHTTDQGGEIVGDLGNASPPVIGESAGYESGTDENPDVQLRI